MAITFARSTLALAADTGRTSMYGLLIAIGVLSAWLMWFVFGRLTLFETTEHARLEVHRAVHPVQSPASGRVIAVHMALGLEVAAGDVLVELSDDQLTLEESERRARVAGIEAELVSLRAQIDAQRAAIREQSHAGPVHIAEARVAHENSLATAAYAETEAERARALNAREVLSEVERLRAEREARTQRANATNLEATVSRVAAEQRTRESDQRVDLARFERELTWLQGQLGEQRTGLALAAQRIEERRIRAPVSGALGEIAHVQVGSVLQDGDRVASVVPTGSLRVIAEYAPSRAVGRIEPGQTARVRFDGFPWTQFGSIAARVTNVGDVPNADQVRVELSVFPDATSPIPLQHGLPGSVAVEVEHVAPLSLALRLIGQLLRPPAAAPDGSEAR